jgi:hypothetical protein
MRRRKMNAEHTRYLFEKYPDLYRGRYLPITQNLMPFGFETNGDGWFKLIDQLSADITAMDKECGTETIAVQVKEKYGGLRFYVGGGSDSIYELIDEAEELSLKTCERCGEPGTLRGESWVYTMCERCWDKKLKSHEE